MLATVHIRAVAFTAAFTASSELFGTVTVETMPKDGGGNGIWDDAFVDNGTFWAEFWVRNKALFTEFVPICCRCAPDPGKLQSTCLANPFDVCKGTFK